MATGALAKAQNAANIARAKIRQLESPLESSKDLIVVGAGAFSAGFVDTWFASKMPEISVKPSPLVGVAGVVAGIAMNNAYLVEYAGGMLTPIAAEVGKMAANRLFNAPTTP